MSKFHFRIAGAQDTDIVCTKIEALCAFHDDHSKLDPAFFHKVLDDPETQLRVILAEDRGQVIGLMAYYPMFRLHSATSGLHLHQLFIDENYRGQGCAAIYGLFNQCRGRVRCKLHHRVGRFTKRTRPSGVSGHGI